ncbi:MAG: hypothetical protein ABI904_08830 [Chloroflexota bacterium]
MANGHCLPTFATSAALLALTGEELVRIDRPGGETYLAINPL